MAMEHEAAGHIWSIVRKQRDGHWCSAAFILCVHLGPQPREWHHPHGGGSSHLNQSVSTFPRRWSQQDEPSQQLMLILLVGDRVNLFSCLPVFISFSFIHCSCSDSLISTGVDHRLRWLPGRQFVPIVLSALWSIVLNQG